MLKRQKLFMALLSVLSLGYFSNFLAWGDYATEPDHETSGTVDAAERNTAREEAERAEHERVADWGKKSLKDKLSSISLFRNRNTYSDAAADRNTVSLGEALKFTFGKKDAADKSIVDHKKTSAAQDKVTEQFERNAKEFERQNQEAAEKARIQRNEKLLELDVLKIHKDDTNKALDGLGLKKLNAWNVPSQEEVSAAYQKELTHIKSLDLAVDVKQRFIEKLENAKNYFEERLPSYIRRAKLRAVIRS